LAIPLQNRLKLLNLLPPLVKCFLEIL